MRLDWQDELLPAIFYAENIAAGANTVTISVSTANTLRFAIAEYSGVASSGSLDVATAAQGSNASPNSGSVTTTANGDLLLSAIMTADPGSFHSRERILARRKLTRKSLATSDANLIGCEIS